MTTALEGGEGSASRPGRSLVLILQEAGWVPGPVWRGAENLAFSGIRSPGRPVHSPSLYRLLNDLYWSSDVVRVVSKHVLGNVTRMGDREVYRVLDHREDVGVDGRIILIWVCRSGMGVRK